MRMRKSRITMKAERNRKIIYWLLPLAGILFCLWYVKSATCDVVYSDYIRLVNSYLPDVWNPEKFCSGCPDTHPN